MAWYSPNEIMTKDCLLNFIIGNRGGGKTYGFKKQCLISFIKKREQFIYLRRYKSELKKIKTFFNDLKNDEDLKEHTFYVKGNEFYIDDEICGWCVALSTSKTEKSTAYPFVTRIIFDEFLIERKAILRYLPNEVDEFLDFFETVARTRDNVKAYFIGNSITIVNPYFLKFKIIPNLSERFNIKNDICVEFFKDSDFITMKKKTRFGKLITDTDYGNYAIENEMKQDNDNFIKKKTPKAKHQFIIKYKTETYGIWIDFNIKEAYVSYKKDDCCLHKFVFIENEFCEDVTYISSYKQNPLIEMLCMLFKDGSLYFDNQNVKVTMYEIFSKINIF